MELRHIAIIMDGNGRWAERRGLPRSQGHIEGTKTARRITRAAGNMRIPFLTLYALSTENLYRPQKELDTLTGLMRQYLESEVPELIENRVRLLVIGDRKYLPGGLRKNIALAERETAIEYEMTLTLAICYGARDEIVRAMRSLAENEDTGKITEQRLSAALDTAGLPDPDLLIRTGGDMRISNFMLWQLAYTELYFTRTLWPDFQKRHLRAAIEAYRKRERRFGRRDESPDKKRGKRGRLK